MPLDDGKRGTSYRPPSDPVPDDRTTEERHYLEVDPPHMAPHPAGTWVRASTLETVTNQLNQERALREEAEADVEALRKATRALMEGLAKQFPEVRSLLQTESSEEQDRG